VEKGDLDDDALKTLPLGVRARDHSYAMAMCLVRGRQGPGLLKLHFLIAADRTAFTSLGAEHFGATSLTFESLT